MTIFQFSPPPGPVEIRNLTNVTVEFHNEAGALFDTYFNALLTTWNYTVANPFGAVGNSATSDELITTSDNDLVFWDWETVNSATASPEGARYFLPTGGQVQAIDIFTLGDGNDILNLTYDASVVGAQSYGLNATAYGGDGFDQLMGGAGNDSLFGGEAFDYLYGGAGDDLLDLRGISTAGSEVAYGGTGDDDIYGDEGIDFLFGGSENDYIEGNGGTDTIVGGVGNDTIFGGGGGNATTDGDQITGDAGDDTIYGGAGADEQDSGTGNLDRQFGGDGVDALTDPDGFVMFSGGGGNDTLYSNFLVGWVAPGNLATVHGGGGADNFGMNSGQANLNLVIAMDDGSADANDTVGLTNVANSYASITATMGGGDDTFHGADSGSGNHIDRVAGDAGDDTLYGGSASDTLTGGTGFVDILLGGANTALASDAGDAIFDSDGVGYARGGEGDDTLTIDFASNWTGSGGSASNVVTLDGNGGSDGFVLGSANAAQNLIINADDGSADGNDTVNWFGTSSYAAVTATMGSGTDFYSAASAGGSGNRTDTVYGGLGTDTIYGGAGFIDRLYGDNAAGSAGDGADIIRDDDGLAYARGGDGDDSFTIAFASGWVGPNADSIVTLDGNGGNDTMLLFSDNALQQLIINGDGGAGTDGNDVVNWSSAAASYDVVTATMGSGNDNYIGTGPGGGAGNRTDIVSGNLGNDTLSGGTGDDTLYGSDSLNASNDGDDTLFGRGGDDILAGGYGLDTLNGETGNDVMQFNADITVSGDNVAQDFVRGWDGESTGAVLNYDYSGRTINYSFDIFDGGGNLGDSLVATSGDDVFVANTDDIFINGSGQASAGGRLAGIEIVLLGAGADIFIANDPTGTLSSGGVYGTGLTVYGGNGLDVVYTGGGADLLVGDGGVGNADVLGAGAGNDTIWGDQQGLADSTIGGRDVLYGGSGNDTIFGGALADSLYGGAGADTLNAGLGTDLGIDLDNVALLFGGEGDDTFALSYHGTSQGLAASRTGNDAVGDGDDKVYIFAFDHDNTLGADLSYDSVSLSMGLGNDLFISANVTSGNGIDRIQGESGNDVISSWSGTDTIDGGSGEDALWGGAGGDTIYGGPDTDYIYAGSGTNDMMFGGTGQDLYYWARVDDAGDQIFDEFRGTDNLPGPPQQASNYLVVFPGYDGTGNMPIGTGVVEVDHILTDNAGGNDMVQLVDLDGVAGTMWRMDIIAGAGAGSSVTFDQRDIDVIALWNHEPGVGQQVIQMYEWDPLAQGGGAYVYVSG